MGGQSIWAKARSTTIGMLRAGRQRLLPVLRAVPGLAFPVEPVAARFGDDHLPALGFLERRPARDCRLAPEPGSAAPLGECMLPKISVPWRQTPVARPPGPNQTNLDLLREGIAQLLGRGVARHDFIAEMVGAHGDLVDVRDPKHLYLASHPDMVRQALVTDGRITNKGAALEFARRFLGDGILMAEGKQQLRNRRLVAPAFSSERIAHYTPDITRLVAALDEDFGHRVDQGLAEVDMAAEMGALALRIAGFTLLGVDLSHRAADLATALTDVLEPLEYITSPAADLILRGPTPWARRARRGADVIHELVDDIVAEHRARPEDFQDDVLSSLLGARGEEGEQLSDEQIRAEVTTLLLAGHETSANLLTWAWYALDANPAAAALLHEEIDHLPDGPRPEDAFAPALPVTRAVVAETLRLHPPVWAVARRYTQDAQMGDHVIPAQTEVVLAQWVVHRDPRWWGDDAGEYRPQRWLAPTADGGSRCPFDERAPGQPRYAFFPFGAGRRVCVGEQFAWAEAVLALAALARNWAPTLRPGWAVDEEPLLTMRPLGGLPMTLVRREPVA